MKAPKKRKKASMLFALYPQMKQLLELDQARRINPKDDRVFQAFGTIMMQQQKFAVAARVFAEAARLNPRKMDYLVLQGTALINQAARIDPTKSRAAAEDRNYAFTDAETVLSRAYQLSGKKLATVHLNWRGFTKKEAIATAPQVNSRNTCVNLPMIRRRRTSVKLSRNCAAALETDGRL